MDSTLRTQPQNLDVEGLHAGRCDISSLSFQTDGQFVYGFLTFHGRLVQDPLKSYNDINALPPLELPGSDTAGVATNELDQGSTYGISGGSIGTHQNGYESNVLENTISMEANAIPDREGCIGPILGAIINANSEPSFHMLSQLAETPIQINTQHYPETHQTFHKPFSGSLDHLNSEKANSTSSVGQKAELDNDFGSNLYPITSQGTDSNYHNFDFLHGVGPGSNRSLVNLESKLSMSELTFPDGAARLSFQENSCSSVASSTSSESNFSDTGTLFSQADSVSSAASTSFSDFSVLERAPTPDQESLFSPIPEASSDPKVTTTEIGPVRSPARQSCPLCPSTFKRTGDLKRHSGKHRPRSYHCKQPGCGRKGEGGFYRRDKLRAHERQMHGMD